MTQISLLCTISGDTVTSSHKSAVTGGDRPTQLQGASLNRSYVLPFLMRRVAGLSLSRSQANRHNVSRLEKKSFATSKLIWDTYKTNESSIALHVRLGQHFLLDTYYKSRVSLLQFKSSICTSNGTRGRHRGCTLLMIIERTDPNAIAVAWTRPWLFKSNRIICRQKNSRQSLTTVSASAQLERALLGSQPRLFVIHVR